MKLLAAAFAALILSSCTEAPEPVRLATIEVTAPQPITQATPVAVDITYVVVKGDSLWKVSKTFYGKGAQFPKLVAANHLKHPNLIHPGQRLVVPTSTPPSPTTSNVVASSQLGSKSR